MILFTEILQDAGEEFGYKSSYGHTVKREWGQTPNGNHVHGRWVLRGPKQEWIDFDQYRHDLLERNNMKILYPN